MFSEPELVTQGALAAHGVSLYDEGRLLAKYVQRVLSGNSPKDLPIESFSKYELGINLETARELGITMTTKLTPNHSLNRTARGRRSRVVRSQPVSLVR